MHENETNYFQTSSFRRKMFLIITNIEFVFFIYAPVKKSKNQNSLNILVPFTIRTHIFFNVICISGSQFIGYVIITLITFENVSIVFIPVIIFDLLM